MNIHTAKTIAFNNVGHIQDIYDNYSIVISKSNEPKG